MTEGDFTPSSYHSISSLNKFARCPRSYFYYRQRLDTRDPKPAMDLGSALHRGLPFADKGDLQKAHAEFLEEWDNSLADDRGRTTENAFRIMEFFAHSHKEGRSLYTLLDPPPGTENLGRSPYEIFFAIDIGMSRPLVGYLDGWVKHRDRDAYYVLDYKTYSSYSARNFGKGFEFDPQVIGYALAGKTLLPKPIKGTIIEGVMVDKKNLDCSLHIFDVEDHLLEDFINWAKWLDIQIQACERSGDFPKQLTGCYPYAAFGTHGFMCDYHYLCRVPDWKDAMPLYVKRSPSPVEDHLAKGAQT